jgi:hypothetical protein
VTVGDVGVELFSGGIPGRWESLLRLLQRYSGIGFRRFTRRAILDFGCMIV